MERQVRSTSSTWKKVINGVQYPFGIAARVSAQTGEIIGFQISEDEVMLPSLIPTLSREQVLSLVRTKVSLQPKYSIEANLFVTSRLIGQRLMWRVIANGTKVLPYDPGSGQVAYAALTRFEIDANSGEIVSEQTVSATPRRVVQLQPPAHPTTYTSVDYWPLLTANATHPLFFLTSRNSDGYKYLLASARGKQLSNLFTAPGYISSLDWANRTQRLTFGMSDTIYILDLRSGTLGQCNNPERARRTMPSWDSTGHLIAMSGTHSPSDLIGSEDSDIFIARISETLSRVSMSQHWCVSQFPGEDILPVFTPDNKLVAFAHQEGNGQNPGSNAPEKEQTWSIYLADASKGEGNKRSQGENSLLRKVVGGLPRPERLSWFSDGRRLLVSYMGNDYEMKNPPQIIDVEAKAARPWKLPVLHDPDLPQSRPLIVREPGVSADGKRVVFRALRWTGEAKDSGAVCIYSCSLDGTALTRLTPPTVVPLPPLTYPQPGINALNAWDKLEPKRNLGTPVTP